nr:methyl-accepting chemotaxis protein [uncultured Desulfobacter sp.]
MFKTLKLTGKLMLSVGTMVVLSFVITVSFITTKATDISSSQAIELLDTASLKYADEIKLDIDGAFGVARSLSYATQNMKKTGKFVKRETLLSMMEGLLNNNPGYLGIWVVWEPNAFDGRDQDFKGAPGHDEQGRFIPYWNRVGGVHLETCGELNGEWYTKARDTQKEVIMDPFEYKIGGQSVLLVSVCVPIVVDGTSIGVAGVDFSMEQIGALVDDISVFETGYAVLSTETGMITAHPNKENVGKTLGDVYPEHVKQLVNNPDVKFENMPLETTGEKGVIVSNPINIGKTGTSWTIFITAPTDRILSSVYKMRNLSILICCISLGVLAALIFFLARIVIVSPVNRVVGRLDNISRGEGDLTQRLDVTSNDELGRLADVFNSFINQLQGMIKDIAHGVDTLSSSSTELSAIAQQMSDSSAQTSNKSRTVAAASEEMSKNMNSISAAMEQSSANTNTVATAVDEMNSTINEIAQNSESARSISENAVSKVEESSGEMNRLNETVKTIGQVVETITDISEQVNLLSLNATIEAARAGEAGKGFAVVANEIKDLAGQTAQATKDIKERIENIQNSSSSTVKVIGEINGVILDVNDIVGAIATAVEEQSAATKEIAENVNQVSNGIQEVNQNVGQSTMVVNEISKDISDVNQSADDMATRSREVSSSSEDLSKLAAELHGMIGKFKV